MSAHDTGHSSSGVGAGAAIDLAQRNIYHNGPSGAIPSAVEYYFNNLLVTNGANPDTGIGYGTFIKLDRHYLSINGCTISNCTTTTVYGNTCGCIRLHQSKLDMTNTKFNNNCSCVGFEQSCTATLSGCVFGTSQAGTSIYLGSNNVITLTGNTISEKIAISNSGNTINFSGFNRYLGYVVANSQSQATFNFVAGSTISLLGNVNSNAFVIGQSSPIIVAGGDSTKSCTIIDMSGNSHTVSGGTYHTLTNTGVLS